MKRLVLAILFPLVAVADVSLTVKSGIGFDLVRSSTKIGTHATYDACIDALKADAETRRVAAQNYSCRANWDTITARWTPAPVPVACAVSEWGAWQDDMTSACTNGMSMSSQTRARTVTRIASNGGAACPSLTENREVHQSCGGPPKIALPPRGTQVYTTLRVGNTPQQVTERADQYGQMRVPCAYSHMAYDDPIVWPGQPGKSHLHMFFGNTTTDANSTQQSLLAGPSTCLGGVANRSSYWVPAVIDTGLNQAVVPTSTLTYYKDNGMTPASGPMTAPPNGLRMISGNQPTNDKDTGSQHKFECWSDKLPGGRSGKGSSIPAGCPVGGYIQFELSFPQCWDGMNLDSDDHRSHMAHRTGWMPGRCPATHPVMLPAIAFNIYLTVREGHDTSKWRLSSDMYDATKPGGYSAHGDAWINWDEGIKQEWMNGCLRSGADCHGHMLGDGRMMY